MRSTLYRLSLIAMLCVIAVSSGASEKKLTVEEVSFDGNDAFSDERLRGFMVTRPAGFLSSTQFYPDVFQDDLNNIIAFYQQHGYLDANIVDTIIRKDTAAGEVRISVRIDEGPLTRVEGVSIFGNTVFPDSLLLSQISLQEGDPFRRNEVQNGMMAMLNMYAERGYIDAAITPGIKIDSAGHRALIDITITERYQSKIDSIRITGLIRTNRYVVERELRFRKGQVVNYPDIARSQRRLYDLGLFESVFIRPVASSGGDSLYKDIQVELKEQENSEFNVSVGYGSVEKVRGRIELLTHNLSGTARQLGGSLTGSFIRRAAEMSFSEPRTLGTRWQTDINLKYEFLEEPGYDLSRVAGRLTIGRAVKQYMVAQIIFRIEHAEIMHVEVSDPIENFDPEIRSVIFSFSRDTRDNLFNPTRGMYIEISNELAGSFLQGNSAFARSIFRSKYFHSWSRHSTLAMGFELGWMDVFGGTEEVPLSERFYAGGPSSIRGFGYQLLGPRDADGDPRGGKFKIVWNVAELRRSIYKLLGVALFVEVGNVWEQMSDFALLDVRPGAGAGLRANTPLGIVRLDLGVNLDRQGSEDRYQWHISMGQAF